MTFRQIRCLLVFPSYALPVLAVACGGGSNGTTHGSSSGGSSGGGSSSGGSSSGGESSSGGSPGEGGTETSSDGGNSVPLSVNAGPPALSQLSSNVPFIDVTVCVPGTMTCQTIPYVSVDTGSSGMRVLSSALTLTLPAQKASTGDPLVECLVFEDGYTWGSVRTADLRIGGEFAGSIPIQIIGDQPAGSAPSDCQTAGMSVEEDDLDSFGSNGIIGINQIVPDCGSYCTTGTQSADYYSCPTPTTCTAVTVPIASQVPNPIPSFATDNNGAVLELPSVPAGGAASVTGSLIFGIGTQPNNALGSASVLTVDDFGNLTTIFNGATLSQSFIDSGSSLYFFNDTSLAQCTSQGEQGFYCPASPAMLTAQNKGLNGTTSSVSFTIGNADTIYGSAGSFTVFDDIAATGDNSSFDWGLPFFLGRSVFVAVAGASTPGGSGPYVAY